MAQRRGWFSSIFADPQWLTAKRVLQIAILFAAVNVIVAISIMRSYGPSGADQIANALPDFAAFWAAGVATLNGEAALAYDPVAHRAIQIEAIGREYTHWLSWHYPPTFQLIVAPFGALPLFVSFAVWNLATLGLFIYACYRILPGWISLIAAWGVSTSLIVFAIGQTGFLTAALLGLFLTELDRRPIRAGAFLALLTIKPHLGIAAPFALMAGGRWRAIISTTAWTALLIAGAHLILGADIWRAFLDGLRSSAMMSANSESLWALYTTIFGALRMIGASFWPAALAHGAVAVAALWLLVRLWRAPDVSADIKAAVLCYVLAIVTPRMLHYDMHILFIGGLFQVRHGLANGFARWEKSLLLLAAVMPFAFFFQQFSVLLRINALVAPVLLLSCTLGRPELRRVTGPPTTGVSKV